MVNKLKFSHHRYQAGGRFNGEHVLTIARRRSESNPDLIEFGWSLCVPGRWERTYGRNEKGSWCDTFTLIKGDMFCKKTGRVNATTRLVTDAIVLHCGKDDHAIDVILAHLTGFRRPNMIAELALDEMEYRKTFNALATKVVETLSLSDDIIEGEVVPKPIHWAMRSVAAILLVAPFGWATGYAVGSVLGWW